MKTVKEIQEVLDFYNANESLLYKAESEHDASVKVKAQKAYNILSNKSGDEPLVSTYKFDPENEDLEVAELAEALEEGYVEGAWEQEMSVAENLASGFYKTNDADEDDDFVRLEKVVSRMKSYIETGDYSDLFPEHEINVDVNGNSYFINLLDEWGVDHEDQCYVHECIF